MRFKDCATLLDQMDGSRLYSEAIQVIHAQRLDHVENTAFRTCD